MEEIRVGIIGCGGIGVGAHIGGYQKVEGVRVSALCDINAARLNEIGDRLSIPQDRRFLDAEELLRCPDIDAVDICTPNDSHCRIGHAAVRQRKPFLMEKPVGISYEEAKALQEAADGAGVPSMVCFSYRFYPAVRYAKDLILQGKIGTIHSVYANYLKESALWEGRRLDWRFDKRVAGYGVSGDLAVHILDTVSFLTGGYERVCARMGIVVKERLRLDRDEIAKVDTDDYCNFLAQLQGGASATFGITRVAMGNQNRVRAEVYGDQGGLRFDLTDVEHIEVAFGCGNMERVRVPEAYAMPQQQSFADLLRGKADPFRPTLMDGVRCQKVLDALMSSAERGAWVEVW